MAMSPTNKTHAGPVRKRRVIVTGADSTARGVAEMFADKGDAVAVCDVSSAAVAAISADRPEIFARTVDVGDERHLTAFLTDAIDYLGGIDFLINVVGIAGPTDYTEDVTLRDWRKVLDVNLTAMFISTRTVIPILKEQKFGGIVNFSTTSTRTLLPHRTPYIVSKYAVEGLTLNLARELGPFNVRANAIRPGPINNQRLQDVFEKTANRQGVSREDALTNALQYVSMRSSIEIDEIAATTAFLCSDDARHITGQLFAVDGNVEWEA